MESERLLCKDNAPSSNTPLSFFATWARNHIGTAAGIAVFAYFCYIIIFMSIVVRDCIIPPDCSLIYGPCDNVVPWCLNWVRATCWMTLLLFTGGYLILFYIVIKGIIRTIARKCARVSTGCREQEEQNQRGDFIRSNSYDFGPHDDDVE